MIVALVALALNIQTPEEAIGDRIAQSAAAAQALQGELDGAWALKDVHGRTLYVFQITDPPGGSGQLEAAWRGPEAGSPQGLVASASRQGNRLTLSFTPADQSQTVVLELERGEGSTWSGLISNALAKQPVSLAPLR